jgi:hypothetical protein
LAAFNTVKAIKFIKKELDIEFTDVCLWTDSMCVVDWLRSQTPVARFEDNKLAVIADFKVKHIEGDWNPADWASREHDPEVYINNVHWYEGPTWLSQPSSRWIECKKSYVPTEVYKPSATPFNTHLVFAALNKKTSPRRNNHGSIKNFNFNELGILYQRYRSWALLLMLVL